MLHFTKYRGVRVSSLRDDPIKNANQTQKKKNVFVRANVNNAPMNL